MSKRILIVGAGIGGLTLARLLQQQGDSPLVIEKTPEFKPVGAGLIVAANAIAVLEHLGLRPELERLGTRLSSGAITDASGRILLPMTFSSPKASAVALHRSDLQRSLLGPLASEIVWGCTVERLEQRPNGVRVGFSTGREAEFDGVIGADGVRSSIRRLAIGHSEPVYAGYSSWRFVVPHPDGLDLPGPVEMWGHGRRLGLVPIGNRRIYGYTTQNDPGYAKDLPGDRLERFRSLFDEFAGAAPAVLRQVLDASQLISTQIEELTLEHWVRDCVGLIGDAAHAMTPNLGQGAGMAIEDAFVLAAQLQKADVTAALRHYQRLRQPRVRWVQRTARLLGVVGQVAFGPLVTVRNALLRATPAGSSRQQIRTLLEGGPA